MAWTEQQSEAITTRDCGLIVSAAAGSGKTSVCGFWRTKRQNTVSRLTG